ncbi:MAG: ftsL [Glaciihabitans sp.]|jgi:hypothetical protein|nr:ftsL [Glaciihabitans sp.]MDQ1571216.1 hypothetical protein [Actinomycetota bacterium]
MSSNLAVALPVSRPRERAEEQHPRRVHLVSTRTRRLARPKIGYAIIVTAVIFGIFMAQLLLSIALSGGAYRIGSLQGEQRDLARVASALNEKLQTVGSTQNLAANARELGMVSDSSPAFLRASDGKVLGAAAVAAHGSSSSGRSANGATGSVPNSLLTDVPLVKTSTSGHGDANAGNSSNGATESSAGTPTNVGSSETVVAGSGDLPSPTTH